MKVIYRYRTLKPPHGHFSFQLHRDAIVLSYTEHWHTEKGWETYLDVLEDSRQPKETRHFFLCNAGDSLDFLGDHPDLYYVATHDSKSYISYLFETTHLSETEREQGRIEPKRYNRSRPEAWELSRTDRKWMQRPARPTPPASAPTPVAQAFMDAGSKP